jgi:uncharacterized membrane protein YccC
MPEPLVEQPPWVDRLLGFDPGLNRLRSAALSTVSIALILASEALFVRLSGALQIPDVATLPPTKIPLAAAANHEHLVVVMLIGAMVGMASSFGVNDPKAKGQLITLTLFPIPLVAALSFGLAVGGHRTLSLVLIAVIATAGTYLRRFGSRGMLGGMLLFLGFFIGFFLHGAVGVADLGWLCAAIGIGLAVTIAVRFLIFFPDESRALERTERSFSARGDTVIRLVLDLFDNPDLELTRQLESSMLALNEAALMIDAQLGDPDSIDDGTSRAQLAQRIFDVEAALGNVARFTVALAQLDLAETVRAQIRSSLLAVVRRNGNGAKVHARAVTTLLDHAIPAQTVTERTQVVLLHRFSGSVIALADAATEWLATGTTATETEEFAPAVTLFGGWLPGSTVVSSIASNETGTGLGGQARLKPWSRAAIQMGLALAIATLIGDVVSPSRYYWAVIAVFITFMGANTSGEQVRKALYRVSGTVVGIVVGSLAVDAVGHHTDWSLAVILVALFFGFYLMRISNTFFVIAITVVVSQMYQELHEFTYSLLLYRLAETALGAVVTIVVVLLVVPLRTQRVLRVAFRNHIRAIGVLVDHASAVLTSDGPVPEQDGLRNDARAVDAAYQALVATAQPLLRGAFGHVDEEMSRVVRLASASRNYSRSLVTDLASGSPLEGELRGEVGVATATLRRSMDTVAHAMTDPEKGVYVRASSLYDRAAGGWEAGAGGVAVENLPVRDLQLIDGSMATMAELVGLQVTDLDTDTDKAD